LGIILIIKAMERKERLVGRRNGIQAVKPYSSFIVCSKAGTDSHSYMIYDAPNSSL
jgi:hypothetical protein